MKTILRILISTMLLLGLSSLMGAQDFEEWSLPVSYSGQKPVITDFVSAILAPEDIGEMLGEMKDNWDLYKAGKPLPQGRSFLVDVKNGYLRYESSDKDDDGNVYCNSVEFCYWNCADGQHKVIGENTVCTENGKPFMGQFSGVSYLLYDGKTRTMTPAFESDLGINIDYPEGTDLLVNQLPRTGKTVEYRYRTPSGEYLAKYTWTGDKFVQSE